ncbi:MAG: BT0820 family HAD-type phosphatase [Sphingobacterium composti]|uniref:BT0820 family HAD-type phosphatase n=1 Tax=Sphingobacterium composti TaxID=363260 RepID=UPI0013573777|nr:hypothetical protein [Sphingobacterium composti Ten et al. 2007 non Yoo et al. 2007]
MVIAVDFDGTIVEHKYPQIGKIIPFAFDTLKQLQNENHTLILWTVREGELLQEAVRFCADNGLYFFAHNANFPEEDRSTAPRKLKADLFIDDRNFGGLPNWHFIYEVIQEKKALNLQFDSEFTARRQKKKGWFIFK